jgi:hypothetical protein
MDWFPPTPEVPPSYHAEGDSALRYEDVSQDGRLMVQALPHTIGDVIWRKILFRHPLLKLGQGIAPIVTRLVIEISGVSIRPGRPLRADGRVQMAHTVDGAGQVDRLLLNMWTAATAPDGTPVGRLFGEHVLTRPFAPPGERKVLKLGDEVPPVRWPWRESAAVLALPEGAQWLDEEFVTDPAEVVFGLTHTDSNQHVNSLVYPRLFQDAALRRLAHKGLSAAVLAERLEIAYRKPCFAGGRARIVVRAFVQGGKPGVVGAFVSDEAPLERSHCVIAMRFA